MADDSLVGRAAEQQVLRELVLTVQDGMSRVLILVGEPGIGKTRLLDFTAESAADCALARVEGVESEMHLDFAALHRLLLPHLGLLDQLPVPQREALSSVFGLATGPPPDRFRVGLAALTLLATVASERPLICIVDDAHWLDRASAEVLAFVCRRLHADGIGIVIGMRSVPGSVTSVQGLPILNLAGLQQPDASLLVESAAAGRVDPQVARRIAHETGGNPLALLEVAAALSRDQLGGGAALPDALPVGARLESLFLDQVRSLPGSTQDVLLLISAAPSDEPAAVWRAADTLGISPRTTDAAVQQGILGSDRRPAFRHPLIRSAVYHSARPDDRRRVHAALAAATDRARDPDRRAWHLAAATVGHDEQVAAELDLAAERSHQRGRYAAQAAFSLRAAELSAEPEAQAVRLATSGQAHLRAGDLVAAEQRLREAVPALTDPMMQAVATRAAAFVEFSFSRVGTVPSLLLEAAAKATPHSPSTARSMLFEAMVTAIIAHQEQDGWTLAEVARTVLDSVAATPGGTSAMELLMAALATRHAIGFEQAAPLLRDALVALCTGELGAETNLSLAIPGSFAAAELWDDRARKTLLTRLIAQQRDRDDLNSLHVTLRRLVRCEISEGNFQEAERHHTEASEVSVAIGMPDNGPSMRGELWAWQGKQLELRALAASVADPSGGPRSTAYVNLVGYAMTVLEISLRHYPEALTWALPIYHDDVAALSNAVLTEVIEAASRTGDRTTADEAMQRLHSRAHASGTPWALGVLARSTALLADNSSAEQWYREGLALLGETLQSTELARTHLLYGEWLRRSRRRVDARRHLRIAHNMFDTMGATIFADRARAELLATGERARPRTVEAGHDLTPQELQVAGLAANGLTNTEIARQLYITPSTVEYHLNKIFRKWDLTSRRQLARKLTAPPPGPPRPQPPV